MAGGGDPAGVTAALDPRIACVVPFNFSGWQPESSAPPDPDRDFAWFGEGYWETTRGLRGALQVGPSEIKTERTAGRHKPGSLVVLMNCWTASALGCACLFACANVRLADAKVYLLQNAILIFSVLHRTEGVGASS